MITPATSPVKLQRSTSEPPHTQASCVQTRLAFNTTGANIQLLSVSTYFVLKFAFST